MFTMDDEKQLKEKSPHTRNLKPKYQKQKAYQMQMGNCKSTGRENKLPA